mmetsp:Transcript_17905/g.44402  ORF Transcript_17905/g.44402 Transcript_17905/m.44402 type:complete len:92 (+) Transcript_17905:395-670(+)
MKADIGQQQYLLCVQGRKRGGYFQILQQHCSSKAPGEKREALRQETSQKVRKGEGVRRDGGGEAAKRAAVVTCKSLLDGIAVYVCVETPLD